MLVNCLSVVYSRPSTVVLPYKVVEYNTEKIPDESFDGLIPERNIFYRQLDFSSELGGANEILEKEPKVV